MKSLLLTLAGMSALALSSCNTTIGLGRDMRLLGEGMEQKASQSSGGGYSENSSATGGAPVY